MDLSTGKGWGQVIKIYSYWLWGVLKNIGRVKNIDEFERTFISMWRTARKRKVTRADVEKEIGAYRKEKNA